MTEAGRDCATAGSRLTTCCISWGGMGRGAESVYGSLGWSARLTRTKPRGGSRGTMSQCGQRQAKMAPVMRPKMMPSMKLAMMVRLYAPNQTALGMNENE